MGILNCRLMVVIQFHETLHSLRMGRSTGTTYLEAKLLQQMMAMREEVLYEKFPDLNKAYHTLDRGQCLDILMLYGVVT